MASKYVPTTEAEKAIATILGSAASAKRVDALVTMLEDNHGDDEWDWEGVGVNGARVAVEHVEAYGLRIGVDANGMAATVTSDYGLEITA